jgi:hypothetical protein
MLTFKEVLCLLAIVIAYGIAGRMDYEDALLLEEALQQDEDDCAPACDALAIPPEVGPTDTTKGALPTEGPRADERCGSAAGPGRH